jgi:hypothetical protein
LLICLRFRISSLGQRRHPDPVPYLDHIGYPANTNEAYTKAKDYEESFLNYKPTTSRLSSFTTVAVPDSGQLLKLFKNVKTGEAKTKAEVTPYDNPFHFGLKRCNKCAPNYPRDHFSFMHDEAIELNRKARTPLKNPAKSNNRNNGKKTAFRPIERDRVHSAYLTLKKE